MAKGIQYSLSVSNHPEPNAIGHSKTKSIQEEVNAGGGLVISGQGTSHFLSRSPDIFSEPGTRNILSRSVDHYALRL